MTTDPSPIDISNMPDLARLAEEVEITKKSRLLKRDNKPIALLTPVTEKQRATHEPIEETLALAGAWGERNWDEVEQELDRIRHESSPTPPFA